MVASDDDLLAALPVYRQLRPALDPATFVAKARRMAEDGWRLAVLKDDDGVIRAVAGFRIYENTFSGRHCYVDDLVTDEASRSKGYGKAMLAWLADHAKANGCVALELDSGTQRQSAHAFYFREGMRITDFHFVKVL